VFAQMPAAPQPQAVPAHGAEGGPG
jgi:hypothetical protein